MDSVGVAVIFLRGGRVLVSASSALLVGLALFPLAHWLKEEGERVPRVIRVASERAPDARAPEIHPYSELATATPADSPPALDPRRSTCGGRPPLRGACGLSRTDASQGRPYIFGPARVAEGAALNERPH